MSNKKSLAFVAVLATIPAAHAGITYNIEKANVVFNTGQTSNLTVTETGNKLDFTAGSLPLAVGDGAYTGGGRSNAEITILYTVNSTVPIANLGLTFSGSTINQGGLTYTEYVESIDGSKTLGSVSGSYFGAGLGGSNTPFTPTDNIHFSTPVNSYKVKKSFSLMDFDSNPAASYAALGYIEQNAQPVPEPLPAGVLGLGIVGLVLRRRK